MLVMYFECTVYCSVGILHLDSTCNCFNTTPVWSIQHFYPYIHLRISGYLNHFFFNLNNILFSIIYWMWLAAADTAYFSPLPNPLSLLWSGLTVGHSPPHAINVFLRLRNVGVSKCQRWAWPQFHISRTQTVHSSLQLPAVFSVSIHWSRRYGRDRSVKDLPLMQGWLRPRSLKFFLTTF